MDERRAFTDALAADRYDSTTRLVFADWLEEQGLDDEAMEQRRMATPEWIDADKWLHEFAGRCGETCPGWGESDEAEHEWVPITYDDVVKAGHDFLDRSEYFCQFGTETARNLMYEPEIREAYWKNWRIVTGETKEPYDGYDSIAPFTCSC